MSILTSPAGRCPRVESRLKLLTGELHRAKSQEFRTGQYTSTVQYRRSTVVHYSNTEFKNTNAVVQVVK